MGKKRKKPKTFPSDKSDSDENKTILQFFVDVEVAERAMLGTKIKEQEDFVIPEIVPMQRIRDERISLETVKHFFEPDAFLQVAQLEKAIVAKGRKCCDCLRDLEENAIQCDLCLNNCIVICALYGTTSKTE